MNQIIYNSFPRSGNVYAGYVGSHIILGDYSTVHIPQIFGTNGLDMVSIFRKPQDAISSLINKKFEIKKDINIKYEDIVEQSDELCKEYRKYIFYAKQHYRSMYIVKFDDLINDPIKHFCNIADKFNRTMLKDYHESFNSLTFTGKLWDDKHDGHIPREKDQVRISVEEIVSGLNSINDLNLEYEDFIKAYKSYQI